MQSLPAFLIAAVARTYSGPSVMLRWDLSTFVLVCGQEGGVRFGVIGSALQVSIHGRYRYAPRSSDGTRSLLTYQPTVRCRTATAVLAGSHRWHGRRRRADSCARS